MKTKYQEIVHDLFLKIPSEVVDVSRPRVRGRTPTLAVSNFLTNREQGDWAESLVQRAVNESESNLIALKYGRSDEITAGDTGFKEFYESYQNELDSIGKKPDLLLFHVDEYEDSWKLDISLRPEDELDKIAGKAIAALEVRSSAFLVDSYDKHVQSGSGRMARKFLSFTPKAEDLLVIHKWIMNYSVKHFYVQVFFDRIYAISFRKILEIISDPDNKNSIYTLEKNAKNQFKSTIHIDVNQGVLLSRRMERPEHFSNVKELDRGRLLYYVKFKGGKATLEVPAFLAELER